MRFPLAVSVIVVGISVSGLAQQNNKFKTKPPATAKAPKSAVPLPIGKTTGATTASSNARDLQAIERQSTKTSAPPRSAAPKGSAALKPIKDKPNPPINFNGNSSGGKSAGMINQSSNPYKGRLKKKGH